jgi:chromate transporter
VVGVLFAALIHPLWTSTVHTGKDFSIALLAFVLLTYWRVQPWMVVAGAALTCILLNFV